MCGIVASIIILVLGVILVIGSSLLGFLGIPAIITSIITNSVVLEENTIQFERFQDIPFALQFSVRVFNISNPEQVLNGGVPIVNEVGPYTYKLFQTRNISELDTDTVTYRFVDRFEFDAEASYPYTEDDLVTVVNIPYNAIVQTAERSYPNLVSALNLAMDGVFREYNSPISTFRVGDLLLDGMSFCSNPGLVASFICVIIRQIAQNVQNIIEKEDGTLQFSVMAYRQGIPGPEHKVFRGINDIADLGSIIEIEQLPHFSYWADDLQEDGEYKTSVCNMINGTDSAIYPPFLSDVKTIYAINTDICRTVELRYQYDLELKGIPASRYSANEWFLDNDDGCFCINVTTGINQENGCLLRGAMELYNCVGASLVLSYPHFLYADPIYRNGVLGMSPIEEDHRIYMDIETSFVLPDEFADELRSRAVDSLRTVDIVVPILISICCVVLLIGLVLTVRAKRAKADVPTTIDSRTT